MLKIGSIVVAFFTCRFVYSSVGRHCMSILQFLKFLLQSPEAKAEFVKGQVEGMKAHKSKTAFSYKGDGFFIVANVGNRFYRWSEIEEITAYRVDLITIDDLRIDIDLGNVVLTLPEDLPGWNQFIEKLSTKLENVLQDWESKVLQTAQQRHAVFGCLRVPLSSRVLWKKRLQCLPLSVWPWLSRPQGSCCRPLIALQRRALNLI